MPAKLDLLPRKKFQITLENGEIIEGMFGTWALFRFCKKKGVGLEGLSAMLNQLQIEDVVDFVLCAVEQSVRESGKPFTYTDVDVCKWVDEIGGGMGMGLIEIFTHYTNDETGETQKKSQPEDVAQIGQTSNESQPVLA